MLSGIVRANFQRPQRVVKDVLDFKACTGVCLTFVSIVRGERPSKDGKQFVGRRHRGVAVPADGGTG